jgi:hypothetical protein
MTRRLRLPLVLAAVLLAVEVPGAAGRPPPASTWRVSLGAPAQFDLALAAVRFPGRAGLPTRARLRQAPGLLYVAAAVVRRPRAGGPRLLVLSVNERPRGSLAADPAAVGLRISAPRRLGAPAVSQVVDALGRPSGPAAAVCGLGARHAAGDLRALLGAGRPLPGFGAAAAVAQAYDLVCGLPSDPAFAREVRGCAAGLLAGCCPPNALCVAPPSPPPPAPVAPPPPMPPCPPCPRPPCGPQVACPLGTLRVLVCPPPALAC